MSLLLAQPVSAQRASHPELEARGYKGYTTCPLSVLCPLGLPLTREVAYGEYETHIAIFLAATARNAKLITSADGATIPDEHPHLQLQPPPVVFATPQKPSEDGKKKILNSLKEMQPVYEEKGNRHMFVLHQPDYKKAEELVAGCGNTPAVPGYAIHIQALKRVKWLLQVVTLFAQTHTYAAFQEEDLDFLAKAYDKDEDVDETMEITDDVTSWKWVHRVGRNTDGSLKSINEAMASQLNERRGEITKLTSQEEGWSTDDLMKLMVAPLNLDDKLRSGMRTISVPYAVPSTALPSENIGPVSDIPQNSRGILFPYIENMNMPDDRHFSRIVLSRFIRLLGTDQLSIAKGIKTLKRDISQITTTSIGKILAHMFTGIDIALGAQARIYFIVEGPQYLGFVLLGTRFLVSVADRVYAPYKASELATALSKLRSSSSARIELAKYLSEKELFAAETTDGDMVVTRKTVTSTDIQTSRDVLNILLQRKISEKEMVNEFFPIYSGIRFDRSFRPLTISSFLETLILMKDPKSEESQKILRDAHFYIPAKYTDLDNDMALLLASHGPETFGPFSPKGHDMSIGKKKPYKVEVKEGKGRNVKTKTVDAFGIPPEDRLEKIILARVGITRAISDWKTFINKGSLKFDPKERAQGSRGVVIQGSASDDYQSALADLCVDKGGNVGEKRKRSDEDEASDAKKSKHLQSIFGFEYF